MHTESEYVGRSRLYLWKPSWVWRWAKLASDLLRNDAWASEKVCMRCESVVNMTGPSVLTASSQPLPGVSCQDVHSCSGRTVNPARRCGVSRLCPRPVNTDYSSDKRRDTSSVSNFCRQATTGDNPLREDVTIHDPILLWRDDFCRFRPKYRGSPWGFLRRP